MKRAVLFCNVAPFGGLFSVDGHVYMRIQTEIRAGTQCFNAVDAENGILVSFPETTPVELYLKDVILDEDGFIGEVEV